MHVRLCCGVDDDDAFLGETHELLVYGIWPALSNIIDCDRVQLLGAEPSRRFLHDIVSQIRALVPKGRVLGELRQASRHQIVPLGYIVYIVDGKPPALEEEGGQHPCICGAEHGLRDVCFQGKVAAQCTVASQDDVDSLRCGLGCLQDVFTDAADQLLRFKWGQSARVGENEEPRGILLKFLD
jgi:hypothetical protein